MLKRKEIQIFAFSAKAMSGKTTFTNFLVKNIKGKRVVISPMAKRLKEQAKDIGWDGQKDEKGRTLLQELSWPIKHYYGMHIYAKWAIDDALRENPDIILIDDLRMLEEVRYLKSLENEKHQYIDFKVRIIRLENPNCKSILTAKQLADVSETEMDTYTEFDERIMNDGGLEELEQKALDFIVKYHLSDDKPEYDMENPNLFSKWYYPVVEKGNKDSGLLIPKTLVFKVPKRIQYLFSMDNEEQDRMEIRRWIKESVLPNIPEDMYFLFVKNGTFSDKFSGTCFTKRTLEDLTSSVIKLNYASMCLGAGGYEELIIRENLWGFGEVEAPTIYDGLALTPEFRIFYNFDTKKVIKTSNYWNYDYVRPYLDKYNDKLVFDTVHKDIDKFYDEHVNEVSEMISKMMSTVDNLSGCWSVDVMFCNDHYYFIDMAIAEDSAYY